MSEPTNLTPELFKNRLHFIAELEPCAAELEKLAFCRSFDVPPSTLERALQFVTRSLRPAYPAPPPFRSLAMRREERETARTAPRCIVENYLFADVALLSAAGGTGKTTLMLFEIVHIILGKPLYGLAVKQPGPVLLVTAEDPREILLGRLHRIMERLNLTEQEQAAVERDFLIWDVSGEISRLVTLDSTGNLTLTGMADDIIEQAQLIAPVLIVMDPIVSFGPGEARLNDAEQMLILAARRMVRALDCCVRYVTHVSQNAANNGTRGQYAARGGTALSDGARMVAVLNRFSDELHKEKPPVTLDREFGDTLLLLDRPKLSYAPPQPVIWLSRQDSGWTFASATPTPKMSVEANRRAQCDQVENFLTSNLKEGRRYSRRQLEDGKFIAECPRDELRAVIAELEVAGRVASLPLPKAERVGRRTDYLHPVKTIPIAREVVSANDRENTENEPE